MCKVCWCLKTIHLNLEILHTHTQRKERMKNGLNSFICLSLTGWFLLTDVATQIRFSTSPVVAMANTRPPGKDFSGEVNTPDKINKNDKLLQEITDICYYRHNNTEKFTEIY